MKCNVSVSSSSESDGNHSTEDEASKGDMEDITDKPVQETGSSTAPLLSFTGAPGSAGGQFFLNSTGGFLTSSHPLLLNGSPILSGAGTGVIINGLTLSDGHTVTLSPVTANAPLLLNGAQVIAKEDRGVNDMDVQSSLPNVVLTPQASLTNTIPLSLSEEAKTASSSVSPLDFITLPEALKNPDNTQSVPTNSLSTSTISTSVISSMSLPSVLLTQNSVSTSTAGSANSVISSPLVPLQPTQPPEIVVLAKTDAQAPSCSSSPQVLSLPQVVPSIQGIPLSQLMQHPPGATLSSCPQLVPVSPLNPQLPQGPIPQFPTQTLHIGPRLAQAHNASNALSTNTALSLSQLTDSQLAQGLVGQLGDESTLATHFSQTSMGTTVIPISSPTQVVPVSHPKDTSQPQLVPLSLPQFMPVSSIAATPTGTLSFPQVVPAAPSLSIPSPGGAFQILTSGSGAGLSVAQGPIRLSPIGPPQSVPTASIPGVQLLNSGVIQLPSASPGKALDSNILFALIYSFDIFNKISSFCFQAISY